MSLNTNQNLGYTARHNIDFSRNVFLNYAQQKKKNELGLLLGYNLISPDNSVSIMNAVDEGAVHTTPEELDRYIYELLAQLNRLPPIPKKANAPEILFAESGNKEVIIYFNPGKPVDDPVTNYKYSTDGGATFRDFGPPDTISPFTITNISAPPFTSLVNGTPYTIVLKAINAIGESGLSNSLIATPYAPPDPPINLSAQVGNRSIVVSFEAGDTGGVSLTNYLYSTDDGFTFVEFGPPITQSPVTITRESSGESMVLDNGTEYTIRLKAKTSIGISESSEAIKATPQSVPEEPRVEYTISETGEIIITVIFGDDGGLPITEIEYTTDPNAESFISIPL